MTPKEKAEELLDRFKFNCRECDYEDNAKQCALMAVDEILQGQYISIKLNEIEYWKKVKKEINKL